MGGPLEPLHVPVVIEVGNPAPRFIRPSGASAIRVASAVALSIPSWFGILSVRVGFLVALGAPLAMGATVAGAQDPPETIPPVAVPLGVVPPGAVAPGGQPPSAVAPEPTPAVARPSPLPRDVVILDGAADVVDFWKKLAERDYMIIRPGPDANRGPPTTGAPRPPSHVVNAVKVRGSVNGDKALLELRIDCATMIAGPVWVPLRLDESGLVSAKEGDRELELRQGPGNQWEARLEGEGEHQIRVELLRPVRSGAERKSLELAIPEAPATSLDLTLPPAAFDVDLGSGETIGQTVEAKGKRVRLSGHIAPRSRLTLGWSEPTASGAREDPLLTALVEMAVDVDAETVATRSSWAIRCERGVARSLQIRLEDDETVARLQLNDQFPASGIEQTEKGNLLTIPLDEPLRPGETRRLVLETRRASTVGGAPLVFQGYPLTNAGEQSGAIGITHGPDLFLNIVAARGLRRIDPRDLPSALKARPGTTIALQFLEQALRLELALESSPPLYRADSITRLIFDPDTVHNETTLNLERARGVLYEVEIDVAPGLKITSVGPAELIESTTAPIQEPDQEGGEDAPRPLKIRLSALARDQKSLALRLAGTQSIPSAGEARLGLFAPRGAVSTAATLALYAGRGLTVEPVDQSLVETDPRPDDPATLALQEADPSAPAPSPRLHTHRNPDFLDVRLERHALSITHDASLAARVSRRLLTVRQETTLRVRHGLVQSLVVRVPDRASNLWDVSGKDPIRREDLGVTAQGIRRFRLIFDRPVADDSTLVFRFRLPLSRSLETSAPAEVSIPWIAVEEGTPGNLSVDLSADPDVRLAVNDPAWTSLDETGAADPHRVVNRLYRLNPEAGATSLNASAQLLESVEMPRLVVSRALIQSTLGFDGELRVRTWYALETHPSSLSLSPPENARWLRARVNGVAVDQIDADADGLGHRLDLPTDPRSRPVVVDLEYQVAAQDARASWSPPVLLDGADVLQSYWLARVPWKSAIVGVPGGWSDENQWYWDYYVWKRRPLAALGELVGWVAGPSAAPEVLADVGDVDSSVLHGYLFGRAGAATDLKPWVASRAWIIVVCSGLALLVGLGLFAFPISERRLLGIGAIVGLSAAILLHPSIIALFLQAAAPGALLVLLGRLVHRAPKRDAPAPSGSTLGPTFESSQRSVFGVGSDDSTAIRRRVPSTMDHRAAPSTVDYEAIQGSTVERPQRAE